MRHVNESGPQVLAQAFQLGRALVSDARGPALHAPEDEKTRASEDQNDEDERDRPVVAAGGLGLQHRALDAGFWTLLILAPKKYRPPRPMGVKGGCSPQNNLENCAAS